MQFVQNAAADLVFNQPRTAYTSPLFIPLHWLPAAAHIKFKSLMLAYRAAASTATTYLNSLIQIYEPSRSLQMI